MLFGISYSVLFPLNSKENDAVSCISYFALFKLNGEKKRMLHLVFHILYCVRCVQLWERTDAVEQ